MHHRNNLVLFLFCFLFIRVFGQPELNLGIKHFENKEWDKTIYFFKKQIEINPNSMPSYHYLGAAHLEKKQFREGYDVLFEGVKRFPSEKALLGNFITAGLMLNRNNEPLKYALDFLKKFPNDNKVKEMVSLIYLQRADGFHNDTKFESAIENANLALKYNSKEENALLIKIYSCINLGKNEESLTEAARAIKLFPRSSKVTLGHLSALIANNEYEKALNIAIRISKVFHNDIDFQVQLGLLYRANYKLNEASSLFDDLLRRFPKNEKVFEENISFYESVNMFDKVRELYETHYKVFNKEKEFKLKIAETYRTENNALRVRKTYLNMLENKEDTDVRMLLVNSYLDDDSHDSAAIHIYKILDNEKNNYTALKLLYDIYSDKDEKDSMISIGRKLLDFYENEFTSHYYLSRAFLTSGDYVSAKTYAISAKQITEKNPYPYEILGDIYLKNGLRAEAKTEIKQCVVNSLLSLQELEERTNILINDLKINPKSGSYNDGKELKKETKDLHRLLDKSFVNLKTLWTNEEMLNSLNSFLAEYPRNPFLTIQLAKYYDEINNLDSADFYYKRALSRNPNIIDGHKGLASINFKRKNYSEALINYKRVISIDPANDEAYDQLIKISFLNGTEGELVDDWLHILKTNKTNAKLRERAIEILHKTNRFEEAEKIIRETKE